MATYKASDYLGQLCYGKLLVALLTEKFIHSATALSPWGYEFPAGQGPQSLA